MGEPEYKILPSSKPVFEKVIQDRLNKIADDLEQESRELLGRAGLSNVAHLDGMVTALQRTAKRLRKGWPKE